MADNEKPHEIETIIAQRNMADAKKASAAADAKRETDERAAKVKEALLDALKTLLEEIKEANEAIKRGGRTEEFRFQPNPQPAPGNVLTGSLTLSDGAGSLRDYLITVDSIDGKIVVRGKGVTLQQTLTNILQVKGEDWSKFLSGIYASNMR
jgi:hypothetical protein